MNRCLTLAEAGKGFAQLTRTIYLDKGFFGTYVGEITDDGRLFLVEEGSPDRFYGYVEDDGIYVPAGIGGRTKLIDISKHGNLYLACDSGPFTYGTKIGSVSDDGTLRDSKDQRIGHITPWKKNSGGSGGGGGLGLVIGIPLAFLLVATPIGAVLLWPSLMGSSSVADASKIQLLIITVLGILVAFLAGVSGDKRPKFSESFSSMCFASWVACEVALCVSAAVMESSLGILDWVLLLTFGSLVCLGWAAAASCIAYAIIRLNR